jgi:hypothetical protein
MLAIFHPCQFRTTSNIFTCHTVTIIFATAAFASGTKRDKVGEQSETNVKTHKIMVEPDFILRQRLRKHKGNRKNRDKHETQIKS